VPPLPELTDDALRAEVETEVLGYLRCARAVAPNMVARGWGRGVAPRRREARPGRTGRGKGPSSFGLRRRRQAVTIPP
jgi:NAD(P)-dependent dehydrogenase (short-subunit alcohol dehydrogenase family)